MFFNRIDHNYNSILPLLIFISGLILITACSDENSDSDEGLGKAGDVVTYSFQECKDIKTDLSSIQFFQFFEQASGEKVVAKEHLFFRGSGCQGDPLVKSGELTPLKILENNHYQAEGYGSTFVVTEKDVTIFQNGEQINIMDAVGRKKMFTGDGNVSLKVESATNEIVEASLAFEESVTVTMDDGFILQVSCLESEDSKKSISSVSKVVSVCSSQRSYFLPISILTNGKCSVDFLSPKDSEGFYSKILSIPIT